MKIVGLLALCVAASVWTAGTLMANFRHDLDFLIDTPGKRLEWKATRYRSDLAFCVGISLLPPAWIVSPFLTGFYEHGWVITPPTIEEFQPK